MKKKVLAIIAYLILISTVGFHLWLNFPETQILGDPNDNIFQYSLIARTDWVWKNYGCPLNLSCIPNLIDHVVTTWAEGYPLPIYYSHIPQIVTVSSFHLLIKPVMSLINPSYSLYQYYNITKYLLLTLFPIPLFIALRLVGFSPLMSALGALFGSNFSTDGLYGIDPPSYLWRGWGLTSQLYAINFLPLALAFVYRALKKSKVKGQKLKVSNNNQIGVKNRSLQKELSVGTNGISGFVKEYLSKDAIFAIFFLSLTTAGHLGIGMITLISTGAFLLFDFNLKNIIKRIEKLAVISIFVIAILSYWIIPILLLNKYHIISFWDPIWKFNSYGWYEVIRQFFQGEIFDWLRAPIISAFVITGFFVLGAKPGYLPFSILFAMWFLFYFGRTTWGGLIDLVPGMKDFHQHRFVVGVQVAGLFLIPAALEYILHLLKKFLTYVINVFIILVNIIKSGAKLTKSSIKLRRLKTVSSSKVTIFQNIALYIIFILIISIAGYFISVQTIEYAKYNNQWIGEANKAFLQDEINFNKLVNYLNTQPNARVYAGRPGNWGRKFRLGSSQLYMLLGVRDFDMSQFLPETWSPLSENEQNFDERTLQDYDLLNIQYVVADENHTFPPEAKLAKEFGPFELYKVPTTGWFDVVTSPVFLKSDKTNFINIVHYWHRTYPRRWNMHPLISVEKNPDVPKEVKRILTMKNEVAYEENGKTKNIFADFPLSFPESTPSGKTIKEAVNKQVYKATLEVPTNCEEPCFAMFKMSYHPNWRVKVDGKIAKKYAVFPFYLATPITPGTHEVEFYYQPGTLKVVILIGEVVGFIALLLFIKKLKSPKKLK